MPNTGRRAQNRAELTEQIKALARAHVAEHGAATLSLRAVAREIGIASSAVYRYFASRDELLTALIIDAYDAIGATAEEADTGCDRHDIEGRWLAVAAAIRSWALAHPHEYALIYGTPVPGYAAPQDTVDPAARAALVLLQLVADGVALGAISTSHRIETTRSLRSDMRRLREVAPGVPDSVIARSLLVWTQLFGGISFELFGHLHNVIEDYEALFRLLSERTGRYLLGADELS